MFYTVKGCTSTYTTGTIFYLTGLNSMGLASKEGGFEIGGWKQRLLIHSLFFMLYMCKLDCL